MSDDEESSSEIRTILFGNAGQQFYYYLGGIIHLEIMGKLESINRFIGVGAGAFLAAFLAARCSSAEIMNVLSRITRFFDTMDLKRLITNFASATTFALFSRVSELARIILQRKLGFSPTFKDLYEKCGSCLEVIVSNLRTSTEIIFSYETTPDFSVITALEFGIHMPLLTESASYLGDPVGAGCLTNPLPIDRIDYEEAAFIFVLETPKIRTNRKLPVHLFNTLSTPIEVQRQLQLLDVKNLKRAKLVVFHSEYSDFMGLTLRRENNHKMIEDGIAACRQTIGGVVPISERIQSDPKG